MNWSGPFSVHLSSAASRVVGGGTAVFHARETVVPWITHDSGVFSGTMPGGVDLWLVRWDFLLAGMHSCKLIANVNYEMYSIYIVLLSLFVLLFPTFNFFCFISVEYVYIWSIFIYCSVNCRVTQEPGNCVELCWRTHTALCHSICHVT